MVSMLSSAVDKGFEPRLSETKDYKIGICCFFAKHTALRSVVGFAILGCLSMFEMHPSSLGYEFHSLSYFSKFTLVAM
jgi:hypothetical protein